MQANVSLLQKNRHKQGMTQQSRQRHTHTLNNFLYVPADDETLGKTWRQTFSYISTTSSFIRAQCCSLAWALRVNPPGQCSPTEIQTCWPGKHCPLVGLVLTGLLPVSGSQFLQEEWMMRAGSSSRSARGCLTKSSRLVDFWSSSNSFYGLNSSVGLSPRSTHRCVDHTTDLSLIRSPTCSCGPLLPSHFVLPSLNILFYLFWPSLYLVSALSTPYCNSLCVMRQKLLQTEGALLIRVNRVPPSARKVYPRVVLPQFGHIPSISHHLEIKEKVSNLCLHFE